MQLVFHATERKIRTMRVRHESAERTPMHSITAESYSNSCANESGSKAAVFPFDSMLFYIPKIGLDFRSVHRFFRWFGGFISASFASLFLHTNEVCFSIEFDDSALSTGFCIVHIHHYRKERHAGISVLQ